MILVCGIPTERPVELILSAAERLRVPFVVLDQRELLQAKLQVGLRHGCLVGTLGLSHRAWPLSAFSGVYVRFTDHRQLQPDQSPEAGKAAVRRQSQVQLLYMALADWLELAPCRVMNRNHAMSSNLSKPFQSQVVQRCGFQVPPTLVTNDPAEVREFARLYQRVIYKSISATRSIVKLLDGIQMIQLRKVRHLPTQFQAYIPGTNVRVHIAGERVIATEIDTEAVDYRYARNDGLDVAMRAIELPTVVAERCLALSRALDLPLCGIDLKRTPDDEYFCFEVNPSPAYNYYQELSGQDVAAAIVTYLR
jgi:glutathione synthase/RimK-type ligase-like ATP-grasp enzyme